MLRTKVKGRRVINIILITLIFMVLICNLFSSQLSVLFRIVPDYEFGGNSEIHFIDVGQGDAIAIKMDNNKTMLIDTGTIEYRGKLVNYLDNIILNKTNKIDYLVLTHKDIDHSGNMKYILENYEIGTFYRPKFYSLVEEQSPGAQANSSEWFDEIIQMAIDKNIEMKFNEEGVCVQEGFNEFYWLSPIGFNINESVDSNEYSPVIKYVYKNHSALFTGDISYDTEVDLVKKYSKKDLDVDILKIPHHGSKYSTHTAFLESTSPEFVCISVGENTYGHPSNAVIDRILTYDDKNNTNLFSNLHNTLEEGNIIFTLSWNISVDSIANIDDYSFVSFALYSVVFLVILLILLFKPYLTAINKDLRYKIRNKRHKKLREEKQQ